MKGFGPRLNGGRNILLSFLFKEMGYLIGGIIFDMILCMAWLFLQLQQRDKVKGFGEYRTAAT